MVQAYVQEMTPRRLMHPFDASPTSAPNKSLFGFKKVLDYPLLLMLSPSPNALQVHLAPGASIDVEFSQSVFGDAKNW